MNKPNADLERKLYIFLQEPEAFIYFYNLKGLEMNNYDLKDMIYHAENASTQEVSRFINDLSEIMTAIIETREINRLVSKGIENEKSIAKKTINTVIDTEFMGFCVGYFRYPSKTNTLKPIGDCLYAFRCNIEPTGDKITAIEIKNFAEKDVYKIVNGLRCMLIRKDINLSLRNIRFNNKILNHGNKILNRKQYLKKYESELCISHFNDEVINIPHLGIIDGKNTFDASDKTIYCQWYISSSTYMRCKLTVYESYFLSKICEEHGACSYHFNNYFDYVFDKYGNYLYASYLICNRLRDMVL